jgi:hypothetical protein
MSESAWAFCRDSLQVYHRTTGDMIVQISWDLEPESAHELGRYIADVLGMSHADRVRAWGSVVRAGESL